MGHNPGTNHPRMMGTLHECSRRGVPIIVFNPLKEHALDRFADPQNPIEMGTFGSCHIMGDRGQPDALVAPPDYPEANNLCPLALRIIFGIVTPVRSTRGCRTEANEQSDYKEIHAAVSRPSAGQGAATLHIVDPAGNRFGATSQQTLRSPSEYGSGRDSNTGFHFLCPGRS